MRVGGGGVWQWLAHREGAVGAAVPVGGWWTIELDCAHRGSSHEVFGSKSPWGMSVFLWLLKRDKPERWGVGLVHGGRSRWRVVRK